MKLKIMFASLGLDLKRKPYATTLVAKDGHYAFHFILTKFLGCFLCVIRFSKSFFCESLTRGCTVYTNNNSVYKGLPCIVQSFASLWLR